MTAVFVEQRDGLAGGARNPNPVVCIHGGTEPGAFQAAAAKTGGGRRKRAAIRREFGHIAVPQRV